MMRALRRALRRLGCLFFGHAWLRLSALPSTKELDAGVVADLVRLEDAAVIRACGACCRIWFLDAGRWRLHYDAAADGRHAQSVP